MAKNIKCFFIVFILALPFAYVTAQEKLLSTIENQTTLHDGKLKKKWKEIQCVYEEKKDSKLKHAFFSFGPTLFMWEHLLLAKDNFYVVNEDPGVYRSRQLMPEVFKMYIDRYKIKTIINLRGKNPEQLWWIGEDQVACESRVHLVNVALSVDEPMSLQDFVTLLNVYKNPALYPILFHCRSGSDRTGEVAALWHILFSEGLHKKVIARALKQLHMKYGHIRFAHPKKRDFIKKFGFDYLKLRDELRNNKTLDVYDTQVLKKLMHGSKYFEYAIAALKIFDFSE